MVGRSIASIIAESHVTFNDVAHNLEKCYLQNFNKKFILRNSVKLGIVCSNMSIAAFQFWQVVVEIEIHTHGENKNILEINMCLRQWRVRKQSTLTYRLMQVLSGHGCIGDYLHKTARREVLSCGHKYGADECSTQHTLHQCPAWPKIRRDLITIGITSRWSAWYMPCWPVRGSGWPLLDIARTWCRKRRL